MVFGVLEKESRAKEREEKKISCSLCFFFIVSIIKIYPNSVVRFLISAEGCLQSGGGGGGKSGGGGQSGNKINSFEKTNPV